MPLPNENVIGHHAVLVVGCEEDAQQSKWLIFRNSWGVRWGENGYGFLKFEYIESFGCRAYMVEAPTAP
jgi:C1A family cysteine protease